jgi:outer membrane immunogenic protein
MKFGVGSIAAVVLLIAASGAARADGYPVSRTPRAPAALWSGCYVGGDIGGAWAREHANINDPVLNALTDQGPVSASFNDSGVIGGVLAGCNMQYHGFVAGIEGDWNWTDLRDSRVAPNLLFNGTPVGSGSVGFRNEVRSIESIRGRLGWVTMPELLLYATGGAAWANLDHSGLDAFRGGCPNCVPVSFSNTTSGWVVGAGAEWAATRNWLFRIEYLHYEFDGERSFGAFEGTTVTGARFNFGTTEVDTVRAAMSYKFY